MSGPEKAGSLESASSRGIEPVPHPPDDNSRESQSNKHDNQSAQDAETVSECQTEEDGACMEDNTSVAKLGGKIDVPHPSDLELLAKLEEANRYHIS